MLLRSSTWKLNIKTFSGQFVVDFGEIPSMWTINAKFTHNNDELLISQMIIWLRHKISANKSQNHTKQKYLLLYYSFNSQNRPIR